MVLTVINTITVMVVFIAADWPSCMEGRALSGIGVGLTNGETNGTNSIQSHNSAALCACSTEQEWQVGRHARKDGTS